jgi:hypothetical protein
MTYLLAGMTSPHSFVLTIDQGLNTAVDMSVYGYCKLLVTKPESTSDVEWHPTVISATATEVVVSYTFVDGDLPAPGQYILKPRLSSSPFRIETEPGFFVDVTTPHDIRYCANVDVRVFST